MSSETPSWISRSRVESGSRGLVRITPHSTSFIAAPAGPRPLSRSCRTRPYPVTAVPGSMPRTSIEVSAQSSEANSRLQSRHHRRIDVEVCVDFLHVVQLFQCLDQPQHGFGIGAGDRNGLLRDPRNL